MGVRGRQRRRVRQWSVQKAVALETSAADLGQKVRKFREAIARKEDAAVDLAGELYTTLVEPVQAVLAKKTRLVVIPDASLWSLPFEALRTADGRYLVEDAAIGYAPSLTALATMDAAPRTGRHHRRSWRSASQVSERPARSGWPS